MKPRVVAIVFARGGSRGVPRKNLRMLAGKPLIAHSIETARAAASVERVVVSTDDEEIAEVARRWGAEVPFMRPSELATDEAPEWLAWRHAIRALGDAFASFPFDVMVSVPATSPFRAPEDVERCIGCLLEGDVDAVVTVTPARRSPYFNMVVLEDGYARLFARSPAGVISRRQDAPQAFDLTTVAYGVRPAYVLEAASLFSGRVRAVVVPEARALDIDTELDLEFAEFLMSRRLPQPGGR